MRNIKLPRKSTIIIFEMEKKCSMKRFDFGQFALCSSYMPLIFHLTVLLTYHVYFFFFLNFRITKIEGGWEVKLGFLGDNPML